MYIDYNLRSPSHMWLPNDATTTTGYKDTRLEEIQNNVGLSYILVFTSHLNI